MDNNLQQMNMQSTVIIIVFVTGKSNLPMTFVLELLSFLLPSDLSSSRNLYMIFKL